MKEETVYDQTVVNEEFCESQVKQPRNIGAGVKIGAAAIVGAVVGSAATSGKQALAANVSEEVPAVEEENGNGDGDGDVVATVQTTNAPVAQVSDDMSFGQAFAAARQQLGAGGVFTWHGKVYGTYYKEEWDAMSADEKAEFQASVDYDNIPVHENHNAASYATSHDVADNTPTPNAGSTDEHTAQQASAESNTAAHVASADSADVDIHVISVDHNVNMNGHDVDVAVIEIDGHNGILVDIDHDGIVNGAIIDFNDDGQIQQNEVSPDLSEQNIHMPQMSDGDAYMVMNDDMPDYTNDAIV